MRMSLGLAGAVLAASLIGVGEARACSILPPPMPPALAPMIDESEESYRARRELHMDGFQALQRMKAEDEARARQAQLWESSAAVALVEVKTLTRDVPTNSPMGRGNRADLKVAGWLKGKGKARSLSLAHVDYTSCGPSPQWDVLNGKPGERFVVFFETGAANQAAARGSVLVGAIAEPAIIRALAAKVR